MPSVRGGDTYSGSDQYVYSSAECEGLMLSMPRVRCWITPASALMTEKSLSQTTECATGAGFPALSTKRNCRRLSPTSRAMVSIAAGLMDSPKPSMESCNIAIVSCASRKRRLVYCAASFLFSSITTSALSILPTVLCHLVPDTSPLLKLISGLYGLLIYCLTDVIRISICSSKIACLENKRYPPRQILPPMLSQSFFAHIPSSSAFTSNTLLPFSHRLRTASLNRSHDAPLFVSSSRM